MSLIYGVIQSYQHPQIDSSDVHFYSQSNSTQSLINYYTYCARDEARDNAVVLKTTCIVLYESIILLFSPKNAKISVNIQSRII